MYIPPAKYPKDEKSFNIVKQLPEIFKEIELKDFADTLGFRFEDFTKSQSFMYASQFQENYGSKLVMLFSAIERSFGSWKPLCSVLESTDFTKRMKDCEDGTAANNLLKKEIEDYFKENGSIKKIVRFFMDHLDQDEKTSLVGGFIHLRNYKRKKYPDGSVMITPIKEGTDQTKSSEDGNELNKKLEERIKKIVYYIRSEYVHRAEYFPFPDRKYLDEKKYLYFTIKKRGAPHQDWLIKITFEELFNLARIAFIRFWMEEYGSLSQS